MYGAVAVLFGAAEDAPARKSRATICMPTIRVCIWYSTAVDDLNKTRRLFEG